MYYKILNYKLLSCVICEKYNYFFQTFDVR